MTDRRKETVDDLRKRNIRRRNKIRKMLKEYPEALAALKEEFLHSAEKLARASDTELRVMIGHNQVIESLIFIDAMENENEIPIDG